MMPRSNGLGARKPFLLYGIFGCPLGHTLSPAMQEAAFASLGLKAYYLVLELERPHFRRLMRNLKGLMLDGFNVTVPYKQEIMPYLDKVTPEARAIGAVNTVFRQGSKWVGANTDCDGFLTSLAREAKFRCRGKKVLVLGAGGSARAVIYGLAKEKAKSIHIANRHEKRGREIIRDMKRIFPKTLFNSTGLQKEDLAAGLEQADLVVNTTSVGLHPKDPGLIPASLIPKASPAKRILFYDLIYKPAKTEFLKRGRIKGHKTLNGLGMLLFQGARAFEYWTKRKAPVQAMKRALDHQMENTNA